LHEARDRAPRPNIATGETSSRLADRPVIRQRLALAPQIGKKHALDNPTGDKKPVQQPVGRQRPSKTDLIAEPAQ